MTLPRLSDDHSVAIALACAQSGALVSDDIFAESASKPKTKKTTKKPAAGGAKGEAAGDIFSSEAPSIFDDPLNAMK